MLVPNCEREHIFYHYEHNGLLRGAAKQKQCRKDSEKLHFSYATYIFSLLLYCSSEADYYWEKLRQF